MTTEAEEFKTKGNELFKEGKTDEAIDMYSKAIDADPSNHIYHSNRSAAYVKKGAFPEALIDAENSLELNPDFKKGYSRRAAALQGLKKYDEAIAVLEQAIEKFPDEKATASLKDELENVKRAKSSGSDVAQAARNSQASMMASQSTKKKAASSENLTSFVVHTKASLELQIFALQAQLDLVQALAEMTDEEKMLMLFQLVDADEDGKIDARELAEAIKKRNAELTFAETVERAISMVATFDEDHDARLNFAEFSAFIATFAGSMDATFHEVSEFLILQNMFEEGNTAEETIAGVMAEEEMDEAVLEEEDMYDAMTDPRMIALFALFDKDGTGDINFREAAIGLWQLTDDMEDAAKSAVTVLLMMTEDDARTLDYEQFVQLIMSIVTASGLKFDEAADDMTLSMLQDKSISEDDMLNLVIGEAVYQEAKDMIAVEAEVAEVMDALQLVRLQKLFQLWDSDNDGQISFEELINGMRKFQGPMEIDESVQRAAMVMIGFDEDGTQSLDKIEFAKAMIEYANAADVPLDELVDFMCVVTAMEENSPEEKAYFHAIAGKAVAEIKEIEAEMEALGLE